MILPPTSSDARRKYTTRSIARRKFGGGHAEHEGGEGGGTPSTSHATDTKGSQSPAHISNPARTNGAPASFYESPFAQPFPVAVRPGASATPYSPGGGARFTLDPGTPFPGRQAGGGERSTIFGTSRYGSGYPYGATSPSLAGRPFPYVFFPIPISHRIYYNYDDYSNITASHRPGGAVVEAIIQPAYNTSSVTYRLVGDNASVTAVYAALISNCSVANSSTAIAPFTPSPNTYPLPEQVIQWYRASSFALSLDTYNNTAALAPPSPNTTGILPLPPLLPDTPLPTGLNTTFLACLNATTGASLPLIDAPSRGLSRGAIAGIVVGSLIGAVFLAMLGVLCVRRRRASKMPRAQERAAAYQPCASRSSLDAPPGAPRAEKPPM